MYHLLLSNSDSTEIYFKGIENPDLEILSDLQNIVFQKVICRDTSLRGKVFNIVIKEVTKGKVTKEIDFNFNSTPIEREVIENGDTVIEVDEIGIKAAFPDYSDTLAITFAGKLDLDSLHLIVKYPSLGVNCKLKGDKSYLLWDIISSNNDKAIIPTGVSVPFMAYTPPFKESSSTSSYCILGDEKIEDWYKKFNLKHYYAFFIEIKR